MVVREYMSNASPLHRFFELPHLLPPPNTEAARRDLEAALGLLHKEGFVFGGLRTLNILYSVKGERAFLVDFDGVGKHKEDRYSTCLNAGLGLGVRQW